VKNLIFLSSFLFPLNVFSAGNGGASHGSPMDLIFPGINFLALVLFFIFKLGPKASAHFKAKHDEIKNTALRAKLMKEEAEGRLNQQKMLNSELPNTLTKIRENSKREVSEYKASQMQETDLKVAKLQKDAVDKINNQKKDFMSGLASDLLNHVIAKAKQRVGNDNSLRAQIESQLMRGLEK
jgi:F0F1-type ATP synthase membrane subunit b/b'